MLWEALYEYAEEKPWLGYGFAAGVRSLPLYGIDARTNTAHNIFMDVVIGLGLVGLLLFAVFLAKLTWECLYGIERPPPGRHGCIAALAAGFVCCQATPFVATYWVPPSLSFCCFLALHTLQFYSSHSPSRLGESSQPRAWRAAVRSRARGVE